MKCPLSLAIVSRWDHNSVSGKSELVFSFLICKSSVTEFGLPLSGLRELHLDYFCHKILHFKHYTAAVAQTLQMFGLSRSLILATAFSDQIPEISARLTKTLKQKLDLSCHCIWYATDICSLIWWLRNFKASYLNTSSVTFLSSLLHL